MQREDWHISLEPTPGGLRRLREKIQLDEKQTQTETQTLKALAVGLLLTLVVVTGSFVKLKPQSTDLVAQNGSQKLPQMNTVKLVDMEGTLARATSPGKKVQIFLLSPSH